MTTAERDGKSGRPCSLVKGRKGLKKREVRRCCWNSGDSLFNSCWNSVPRIPDLVALSTIVSSSTIFKSEESDHGLPPAAFLFVELLCWFAQAIRSGAWTYYEATPKERQLAFERVLRKFAPLDFSDWYNRGTADWKDEEKIRAVDEWGKQGDVVE